MLLGSQHNMYLWQEIAWHSACHLTVLLYSFLERALKKLYYDLFKETTATLHLPKGTAKIYIYLAHIFQLHIHEWRQQEPNIYHLLELARKVRNGFVHGNFQKNSMNQEYEEIKKFPPFHLIELIDTISSVLDRVERQYEMNSHHSNRINR